MELSDGLDASILTSTVTQLTNIAITKGWKALEETIRRIHGKKGADSVPEKPNKLDERGVRLSVQEYLLHHPELVSQFTSQTISVNQSGKGNIAIQGNGFQNNSFNNAS